MDAGSVLLLANMLVLMLAMALFIIWQSAWHKYWHPLVIMLIFYLFYFVIGPVVGYTTNGAQYAGKNFGPLLSFGWSAGLTALAAHLIGFAIPWPGSSLPK